MAKSDFGKTSLAQTSYNVAGTVTAAFVTAGLVTSLDEAKDAFDAVQTSVYEGLVEVLESSPAPTSGGYTPSAGGSGDLGSIVLKGGKYAGQTLAQVAADNIGYIQWLAFNTNNKNDFLRNKARAFLNQNTVGGDAQAQQESSTITG